MSDDACGYFGHYERAQTALRATPPDDCGVLMARDAVRRARALAGEVDE